MRATVFRLSLAALLAAPSAALAHTGHSPADSLAHGFSHPFAGLDHLLAMVTIGLLAWQLGGRALWLVPTTFVAVMALGGVLGTAGVALPATEIGIVLSIVVLGAAVALAAPLPVALAMALAGVFAIFHGYAHGAEMPVDGSGLAYAGGFLAATALLHLAGIAAGTAAARLTPVATRAAGAAIAVVGVLLLVQAV